MSKPFSSSMRWDDGDSEDFPPIRNGASGSGGGDAHRGRGGGGYRGGPRNKNKNGRGGRQYKANGGGIKSKEHTPTPPLEEKENVQDHDHVESQQVREESVVSPAFATPEPKFDTTTNTEEHFVTANNSAEETPNGNTGAFSSANLNYLSDEDIRNSNVPELNYSMGEHNYASGAGSKKDKDFHPNMSYLNAEEDDVSNASLIVQLSDTACGDILEAQSFTVPSHDTSILRSSSPLSSSRSAPPDFSSLEQGDTSSIQNAGDSIINSSYHPNHQFQTSTPISSNAGSPRISRRISADSTMNTTGGVPLGGWDSTTIYAEDTSTSIGKANTAFLLDTDDSSDQQISGLGFTREESGICDMSKSNHLRSIDNGNSQLENQTQNDENAVGNISSKNHDVSNVEVEESKIVRAEASPETKAVKKVEPQESKTVTFQEPLHQEQPLSDSDDDREVEEINQPYELPSTVTELTAPSGVKVYLVGTAHFSRESQLDVINTIQKVQPKVVLLELCHSRSGMLSMNEEQIMKEAADMSLEKIRSTIRQSGPIQGTLHLLLLSMTATLTKKLGMAPGGEFRVALQEAKKIHGCAVHLGDRNLGITLNRALSGLNVFQKVKLAWHFVTTNDTDITQEEVEACKQKDLLEKLLLEMAGEFPSITRVLLDERDLFLAHSLWLAATAIRMDRFGRTEPMEGPVVGVVGMGHVAGIVKNWGKVSEEKIAEIMQVPEPHISNIILGKAVKYTCYALLGYGVYKGSRRFLGFPSNSMINSVVGLTTSTFQKIGRLTGR